jgi:hypothetical protein
VNNYVKSIDPQAADPTDKVRIETFDDERHDKRISIRHWVEREAAVGRRVSIFKQPEDSSLFEDLPVIGVFADD